jgi:hypothetical protein
MAPFLLIETSRFAFHKIGMVGKIQEHLLTEDGGTRVICMEVFNMCCKRFWANRHIPRSAARRSSVAIVLVFAVACGVMSAKENDQSSKHQKRVIGATAIFTETISGLSFPARVDTGAETCSLHVEKVEISDRTAKRVRNIGKNVRFLLKANDGKTQWVESVVADAVRVKSSSLKGGEFDHRYKVRLTLQWKDVRKEVLVTLNDRTAMEYPLLIGRNFLRNDFLVDVDVDQDQVRSNSGG